MKKHLFILIFLCFAFKSHAAHIVGGDLYYDYLGNDVYRVTLILFRDCASTGAAYDDPLSLGIFDSNNNLIQNVSIPFPGSTVLPVVLNNPCVTPPTGICTERAIYTTTVSLPASPNGYTISYQRCCRGQNVTNLISPQDTGLTLTTHVPGTNSGANINSTPRFNNYPPLVICNNDILKFDHSALDPDGDVLTYELITPYAGASDVNPAPNPIPPPPYFQVNFAAGYNPLNPLGPGASISIDANTGKLTADPDLLGLFVVGIRVKEYRNGVLIGQSDRDFLFKVVNCVIQLAADIVPQSQSSTFISYCQGLDVVFENQSFGGTNYHWDFGVQGVSSDTSNVFTPSFTFPSVGQYDVMLVVNPGWPCTDTSIQTFILLDSLNISYTVQDSVCITGNSLDFLGLYAGPPNPVFSWNIGPNASVQTASTLNVMNVNFFQAGFYPVTLSVNANLCQGSYTDFVFLYDVPIIDFGTVDELRCAPYLAQFNDSSTSYAKLTYLWDFGDSTSSNLSNPSHLYKYPGVYDVSLTIQSSEGCVQTLSLTKNDLITTYPTPISNFSITPPKTSVFTPFFEASDLSYDGDYLYYRYDDSLFSFERNPKFSFVESGSHTIYQTVQNEFGCRDSSKRVVFVVPQTTVYIPNTFTPDENNLNNVFLPIVFDAINFEMTIFNRWGELIFHTADEKQGWDGTYKNNICPDGTYTFEVKFIDIQTNEQVVKTGFVNLIK